MKREKIISFVLLGTFFMALGFLLSFFFFFNFSKSSMVVPDNVREIIEYNKDLSYTQQIFNSCSNFGESTYDKFDCLNRFVVDNYNFSQRNGIYSVDDMFDKGADCKSYSVFYATLSEMMGYDWLFVQLPTHIITITYFDEGYCLLDQKSMACFGYNEYGNRSIEDFNLSIT